MQDRVEATASAAEPAWVHRTSRGSYVGDAEGRARRGAGVLSRLLSFRETLAIFATGKFRAAHRAQVLGILWPMAYPAVLTAVMSLVFGWVFQTDIEAYPVLLMLGLVPWHFLSHAWTTGMNALLVHADIVKRTAVPPWVVITGTVRADLYNLAFSALSVLPLIAFYPDAFRVSAWLLLLPVVVVCLIVFGLGLALASGVLNAIWRDTGYLVDSVLIALFWATPIIYPLERVPGVGHSVMLLNPMATLIDAIRAIVMLGQPPAPSVLVAMIVGSFGTFAVGVLVYRRLAPHASDHV